MERENKIFTNILIFSEIMLVDQGICDHDFRKEVKIIA